MLFVVFSTLIFSDGTAQGLSALIKENAIQCNDNGRLNDRLYKQLSEFNLIMIGEMHGTNEPANFLISLVKLFAENGDSVQIGLEIPEEEMTAFLRNNSDSSIYNSEFFSKRAIDGRESIPWVEIILTINKINNAEVFFYDTNQGDSKISGNRDSLMYIKIKEKINRHPKRKTITLSGNIHNMLFPYKTITPMGYYLKTDRELNLADKICSVNHRYKSGTMYNNGGKGIQMREISSPDSDYSGAVDYEKYFLLLPQDLADKYNAIYFTRKVTAAKMVREK